jgi:metal-dependent amidase/aminoacylase/carboxypeptidase family protein
MIGTIRPLNPAMRTEIHEWVRNTATMIDQSARATAEVTINLGYSVTINDPELTEKMVPVLKQVVGEENVFKTQPKGTPEDFSYYQQKVPGLFFFVGITPKDADPEQVAMNHSPYFFVDESALILDVRALAYPAVSYMEVERTK